MDMTANHRIVVAERDPAQLDSVESMIRQLRPGWKVVASACDAAALAGYLDEYAPDLVVADVALLDPAGSATPFELPSDVPAIFLTDDPGFAVRAFEAGAIDCILKPLTPRRLKLALDRAAVDPRVVPGHAPAAPDLQQPLTWMTMSCGQDVLVVAARDVCYLRADQKYTRVVTERTEGLVRTGITELHRRLGDGVFLRIHRSIIVNLRFVSAVKRDVFGRFEVHLKGCGDILKVSKNFQHVFRSL